MDYKQVLIYAGLFISGLIVGKVLKINVTSSSSCSTAQSYLNQMKKVYSSDYSDSYLE